jgi:hypothetical protein
MLKRQKITPDEPLQALTVYGKIPMRFLDVELSQTLRISAEQNVSAYDASGATIINWRLSLREPEP